MAIRRYNFRAESDTKLNISPDTIPTLIPADALALLQEGDATPYYKIQAIEYPTKGNGWNYLESFWKSYIGKLNTRAFPGSKSGHSMQWGGRAPADFFLVGGSVRENGDGTGTVYLKNYVPPKGETSDNERFIKLCKAGMIDFSIVSRTKDQIYDDPKTGERVYDCVSSEGSERNDALDYGDGSMDQKSNAAIDFELAESLIREGKVSLKDNGDELVFNGLLSRPMLRRLVSHADGEEKVNIAALISQIDKSTKENSKVTKKEVLDSLPALKANGEITLSEIAASMGLSDQLKTNADTEVIAKYNGVKAVLGEDPVAKANALIAGQKDAEALKINSDIEAIAGKKLNADGTANDLYEFAAIKLNGKTGTAYTEALDALKKNSLFTERAGQLADMTSEINVIADDGKPKQNAYVGVASVTL
jgi:hypothetical protein